jgi:hypothetical protein
MSDFEDNNYNVLSWKFLNSFFSDQSKYRMFVKGVATENVDITLIPSQYFTEEFNKNGMDQLALEDELTEEILKENEEPVVNTINKTSYQNVNENKIYSGMIDKLNSNQIFVFGSNTQGRHGKGAALTAKNKFGAIYGQAEGLQGQSYAIITKDLTKKNHPSRTKEQIIE